MQRGSFQPAAENIKFLRHIMRLQTAQMNLAFLVPVTRSFGAQEGNQANKFWVSCLAQCSVLRNTFDEINFSGLGVWAKLRVQLMTAPDAVQALVSSSRT